MLLRVSTLCRSFDTADQANITSVQTFIKVPTCDSVASDSDSSNYIIADASFMFVLQISSTMSSANTDAR